MAAQTKIKTARLLTGKTRVQAADALFISESTLKRIENGLQKPSREIELAASKLYKAPWVANPLVPEDYEPVPKTQAVLSYYSKRRDVERVMPLMESILADGVVDKNEAKDFEFCMDVVGSERKASADLMYAR